MAEIHCEKCIFKYNQDQSKLFSKANQTDFKNLKDFRVEK